MVGTRPKCIGEAVLTSILQILKLLKSMLRQKESTIIVTNVHMCICKKTIMYKNIKIYSIKPTCTICAVYIAYFF